MVSSVESNFKTELAPILDLVLFLPTNTPCSVNVSQGGGRRGLGSSKGTDEDKGLVVGRVLATQIPTSLPMKPLMTTSTTTIRMFQLEMLTYPN